jgi:predicted hotdog family 3-hydroxylacyl-ACP dehydratase
MDAAAIAALLPHAGAMVLLDRVDHWDANAITCRALSHLDPANPLRRGDRLAAVAGIEYALQAAAVHGGLTAGGSRQPAGYLASLRGVALHIARLDNPNLGTLVVKARLERQEASGLIYSFELRAQDGHSLVSGGAAIALPRPA